MMTAEPVELVEVGPRDGLQSIDQFVPTEKKIALIHALYDAGYRRIEIGSFVSPRAVPQMSDIEAVVEAVARSPGLRASVLVPNLKGAERAAAAGVKEIVYVCSASETHNLKNVHRSIEQSLAELSRVVASADIGLRFSVATAFDCPFEGQTPEAHVLTLIERVLTLAPAVELCLCDTNGRAMPDHVERLFRTARERFSEPQITWAFHAHDTYGLGVANAVAAYRAGVRIFDGSVAGLGGCPFAPGATGNVASGISCTCSSVWAVPRASSFLTSSWPRAKRPAFRERSSVDGCAVQLVRIRRPPRIPLPRP